ncbi:asparagine synthase C-terminal domain-containing protein, partial [Hydrogenimonas sp.]|uniref:asparagine synthase C-terminal domain-containing protein n=1 Tax=Hydrogenimonas sp. TaxID=2231112 RepID=UPI002607ED89
DWVSYFSDEELSELFKSYKPYTPTVAQLWEHQNYEDRLLKSSIVDLKTFLPNNLLYYGDIMSMANSFEVRFPLIDHKIIEFMTSLPTNIRIKEGKTKYIVKKLLEGKVPDRIINKPKLGLNPPMGIWLKKDLDHFIQDHLSRRCIKRRELFNPSYIEKIQEEHRTGKRDRSLYIWGLIVLEEWFRQYID